MVGEELNKREGKTGTGGKRDELEGAGDGVADGGSGSSVGCRAGAWGGAGTRWQVVGAAWHVDGLPDTTHRGLGRRPWRRPAGRDPGACSAACGRRGCAGTAFRRHVAFAGAFFFFFKQKTAYEIQV